MTFKNAGLDSELAEIGLDRVILETDSPYLSPHPLRGKRNEPAYLEHIKSRVAEIIQCSEQEIIDKTSKNARELFDL